MTKERPILFSGPMVRAILEGRKTQTRRVVKGPENIEKFYHQNENRISFMRDGIGWCCSEAEFAKQCPFGVPGDRLWVKETWRAAKSWDDYSPSKIFADAQIHYEADGHGGTWGRLRPSIHMPQKASRITLEVTGVRVERMQDGGDREFWGEEVWAANPWVWVVDFKRV